MKMKQAEMEAEARLRRRVSLSERNLVKYYSNKRFISWYIIQFTQLISQSNNVISSQKTFLAFDAK